MATLITREEALNTVQWIINVDLLGLDNANHSLNHEGKKFKDILAISNPTDFIQKASGNKLVIEVAEANDYDNEVFALVCSDALERITH